jgi:hypothetical protein
MALSVLAQVVDKVPKILRKMPLAAPCRSRGDLKRDRVEASVIAVGMALYERLDLLRVRHRASIVRPDRTGIAACLHSSTLRESRDVSSPHARQTPASKTCRFDPAPLTLRVEQPLSLVFAAVHSPEGGAKAGVPADASPQDQELRSRLISFLAKFGRLGGRR